MLRMVVFLGLLAFLLTHPAYAQRENPYSDQASGGRYRAVSLEEALSGVQGRMAMVLAVLATLLGGASGIGASGGALMMLAGAWLGREKVYLAGRAIVIFGALGLGIFCGCVWYLYGLGKGLGTP